MLTQILQTAVVLKSGGVKLRQYSPVCLFEILFLGFTNGLKPRDGIVFLDDDR